MITRPDIAAHLEHGVRTGFLVGMKAYSPLRSAFCSSEPSDGAFEIYADMGAPPWPYQNAGKQGLGGTDGRTGVPEVNRMSSGGAVRVIGAESQGVIVWNIDWEIVTAVTHNSINDDRTGELDRWIKSSGVNFEKARFSSKRSKHELEKLREKMEEIDRSGLRWFCWESNRL